MKCIPWSPKQNAGIMMRWVVSRSHQEPSPLQEAVIRGTNVLYWSCIDFVGSSSIIMWSCPSVVWHKKKDLKICTMWDLQMTYIPILKMLNLHLLTSCCYFISVCFWNIFVLCRRSTSSVRKHAKEVSVCEKCAACLTTWRPVTPATSSWNLQKRKTATRSPAYHR